MPNLKYLLALIFILFSSCTTYYIPVESFKEQFDQVNYDNLKNVNTQYPSGLVFQNLANQLDSIICTDKNGNVLKIKNKPSLEIRITDKNNKKTIFYFDTVYLSDSLVVGQRSRFIKMQKSIPLNDIVKIEIQDGHKKFNYR